MSEAFARWTGAALMAGSTGLAVYWYGTRLFFDFGGIFGFGAILVLSTFVLLFGIIGLHRVKRRSLAAPVQAVMVVGVAITAIGMVTRSTITLIGLALFTAGSVRSKTVSITPLALVFLSALFLCFEELKYGVLLAIRNDQPVPADAPLTVVRWLAGAGYAMQALGWSWAGITLQRRERTRGLLHVNSGEDSRGPYN